uniref:Uncharacterized protein n=1 Tax=Meloidogyne hapla TaxID=6305 RepID=A0A1I8B8Z1_MELHA
MFKNKFGKKQIKNIENIQFNGVGVKYKNWNKEYPTKIKRFITRIKTKIQLVKNIKKEKLNVDDFEDEN